jgi:hypothetical protein
MNHLNLLIVFQFIYLIIMRIDWYRLGENIYIMDHRKQDCFDF